MRKEIEIIGFRNHLKASERYVDVIFFYSGLKWSGAIPIVYRRTGTELQNEREISAHLEECYDHCEPKNWAKWTGEQEHFWKDKPNADVTKSFFDALLGFEWKRIGRDFPQNPNWARRVQDIKEFGYTIATRFGSDPDGRFTELLLVPLPRGGISGYEVWSPALRTRMIRVLESYDAFEGKQARPEGLLPDHKFPEIRWDKETRRASIEDLTDAQILREFQLLTNHRNQQKREVCRACYQTGKRGAPFGIAFWYQGSEDWPTNISKQGKAAEKGCIGCGWYDFAEWRRQLNRQANQAKTS